MAKKKNTIKEDNKRMTAIRKEIEELRGNVKSDDEIQKKINSWKSKLNGVPQKSLEHGIINNVIAKLENVINLHLTEEQVRWHIQKAEEYKQKCLESKEIRKRQIANANAYNIQAKKIGDKMRMNVPTTENDWDLEKIPEEVIKELTWVVS